MPAGLPSTSTRLDRGEPPSTGIRRPISRGALLSFERPGRGVPAETSHRTLKTAQLANASGFHRSVRCLSEAPDGADHRQDMKGTRWMPWHQESMKGVDDCDKPR